jgi:serine/threonine-protein kinase RsbW
MVTSADEVRLVVPARPELMRLARVTAAGLAGRLAFTYAEIEDIRLAIDQSFFGLAGPSALGGTVEVLFRVATDTLEVEGSEAFSDDRPTTSDPPATMRRAVSPLSEIVLDALVDEHEFGTDPTGPAFRLVKRHRRTTGPGS